MSKVRQSQFGSVNTNRNCSSGGLVWVGPADEVAPSQFGARLVNRENSAPVRRLFAGPRTVLTD